MLNSSILFDEDRLHFMSMSFYCTPYLKQFAFYTDIIHHIDIDTSMMMIIVVPFLHNNFIVSVK